MNRAVVFGGGISGRAAEALLRREGAEAVLLDGDAPFPDGEFDLAVTSPGVALTHPWHAAARSRGVRVISELQLGAERWRARGGRILAVTGSKGKSSVVKLVADTLNLAGHPAVACGNYGRALCDVVNEYGELSALPWAVVEASSFQLETTALGPGTLAAAALLNLQDDHLDRHGSREVYHALKRRLLAMADKAVDVSRLKSVPAAERALFAGGYFDNPVLAANGCAAVALLSAAGLADAAIAAGFAAFKPLPHRMQEVTVRGGVRYIDDSKATSMAALCAGIMMAGAENLSPAASPLQPERPAHARKILLIAGGQAKGDDPKIAFPLLQSGVKKVYLIGSCARQLQSAWSEVVPCEMCGTLENAVSAAKRDAVSGDAVLLSPGTASFDQFKNYNERGAVFAALAEKE